MKSNQLYIQSVVQLVYKLKERKEWAVNVSHITILIKCANFLRLLPEVVALLVQNKFKLICFNDTTSIYFEKKP